LVEGHFKAAQFKWILAVQWCMVRKKRHQAYIETRGSNWMEEKTSIPGL